MIVWITSLPSACGSGDTECFLRCQIEIRDLGFCIGADDAIQSKIQKSLPVSFTLMESLLSLQEIIGRLVSDLVADFLLAGRSGRALVPLFRRFIRRSLLPK